MPDARRAVTVIASLLALLTLSPAALADLPDLATDPTVVGEGADPDPGTEPAPSPRPQRATGVFFWANAWAAHHTARSGYSSGGERMRRLVRIMERGQVTLGALAEVEASQIRSFRRSTSSYRLFVGGGRTTEGVFWDTGAFDLERSYTFRSFYADGARVPVPVVVLRERRTDHRFAVMAVHNPLVGWTWRQRALARELREVRRIRERYDGRVTVFVAGDFNEGSAVACAARKRRLFSVGHRSCRGSVPIDQLLVDRAVRVHRVRVVSGGPMRSVTDHPAVYHARFSIRAR